jgi:chromosome segregation ATPase
VKVLALLACVASLALVAAGCGGDDEAASSTDEWAEELCTTVQDWQDELDRIGEDLGDASLSRDSLREAADEAETATDDFIERLRDLGAPETESGNAVEEEVDQLADIVEEEREAIRESIDEADGLGGVAEALGTIGASIAQMGEAAEQTLRSIDEADASGELETALDDAESCDELRDGDGE